MLTAIRHLFSPKVEVEVIVRGPVGDRDYFLSVEHIVRKSGLHGWMDVKKAYYLILEAEGPKSKIDGVLKKISNLPRSRGVNRMEVTWKRFKDRFQDFRVRL